MSDERRCAQCAKRRRNWRHRFHRYWTMPGMNKLAQMLRNNPEYMREEEHWR